MWDRDIVLVLIPLFSKTENGAHRPIPNALFVRGANKIHTSITPIMPFKENVIDAKPLYNAVVCVVERR